MIENMDQVQCHDHHDSTDPVFVLQKCIKPVKKNAVNVIAAAEETNLRVRPQMDAIGP